MKFSVFLAITLVLIGLTDCNRLRRNYDRDSYDNRYRHKSRFARSRIHTRESGGGLNDVGDSSSDIQYPSTDERSESIVVYTPAFDRYNLNDMEIALAQTLYLMIVPELQKAVEFRMNEIVNQYLQANFARQAPGTQNLPPQAGAKPVGGPGQGTNQQGSGQPPQGRPGAPAPGQHEPIIPVWDYTKPSNQQMPGLSQQGRQPQQPWQQQNQRPGQQQSPQQRPGQQQQNPQRPGQQQQTQQRPGQQQQNQQRPNQQGQQAQPRQLQQQWQQRPQQQQAGQNPNGPHHKHIMVSFQRAPGAPNQSQ